VVSSPTLDCIVDTVVLRYFLFVDRADLLVSLLGRPIGVPRTVFDPDEGSGVPEEAMCELRRSIKVQMQRASDPARSDDARADARRNADRLATISALVDDGTITIVDMTTDERILFSRLTRHETAIELGVNTALGMGEAACVAIAIHRTWTLVTDDDDALKVAQALGGKHHTRIRALLRRAAMEAHITREGANSIHAEMRRLGFWDKGRPFRDGELES
jgi:predicted nucleic acid-binding protein